MKAELEIAPEEEVYALAARLVAVQHAVAEIAGGQKLDMDPRALSDTMLLVRKAIQATDGAYGVFIGGLAVQHHGYHRYTDDVDVVIDNEHYREIISLLRETDFVLKSDFTLYNKDSGIQLDLLKETTLMRNARFPLPHPSAMGPNMGYADIPSLVCLKLDTGGRLQDIADIGGILRRHMDEADAIEARLPDVMRQQFREIVAQARREMA